MEKINKKIIIAFIVIATLVLVFLLQKTLSKSKNTPAQLTTNVNLAAEKAMEAIPSDGVPQATQETGLQELVFKMDNDTKVFNLTAAPVRWSILKDTTVTAWAYNGMGSRTAYSSNEWRQRSDYCQK